MNKDSSILPFFAADGHRESAAWRSGKAERNQRVAERRRRMPAIQQYTP
jgi:hypothetical protein